MARLSLKWAKKEFTRRKLERLPEAAKTAVGRALWESGVRIAGTMQGFIKAVAYDEGVLHDSVAPEMSQDGLSVTIGPRGAYLKANKRPTNLPRWIEFGTHSYAQGEAHRFVLGKKGKAWTRKRKRGGTVAAHVGQPARPFMAPTWAIEKKRTKREVAKVVREQLKVEVRKG